MGIMKLRQSGQPRSNHCGAVADEPARSATAPNADDKPDIAVTAEPENQGCTGQLGKDHVDSIDTTPCLPCVQSRSAIVLKSRIRSVKLACSRRVVWSWLAACARQKLIIAYQRFFSWRRFVHDFARLAVCVVIVVGISQATWCGNPSQIFPSDAPAFNAFRDFVTGRTVVRYALVELTLNPLEADKLFAFAYDRHAFFAREYCTNKHNLNEFCLRDKYCGRKDGHYWYYNGDIRSPLLYTSSSPEDTTAGAYGGVESYFSIMAGLFQTYFLSSLGLNSLEFRNGLFAADDPTKNFSANSQVQLDRQGIVTSAALVLRYSNGHVTKDEILFSYDTPEARARGLPTHGWSGSLGVRARVIELQLLAPGEQVSEPPFIPTKLFSNTNVGRIIHSNKTDYIVHPDGHLSSMDGRIPAREIADLRAARRFFYAGLAVLSVLSLILFRIYSTNSKK